MALWNTFTWSDGTLWADAYGSGSTFTSFIDRLAYWVSVKVTHTNSPSPGSLAALTIQDIRAEVELGAQLPRRFEAVIDRNTNTQRTSVKVQQTSTALTTTAFTIDRIHMLASQRSRNQPTK